jgi:hypothetical protein
MLQVSAISSLHTAESINKKGYTPSKVCGECHATIYNFWKNSLHSLSLEDPIFDTAYMQSLKHDSERAKKTCLKCHAPVVQYNVDYNLKEGITREGISCDFCHTVKDVDLKKENPFIIKPGEIKRSSLKASSPSIHKVEYSELFASAEFCAGCHELKMQNGAEILGTYSEWKRSPYPAQGINCQGCHMPKVEGRIVDKKTEDDRGTISLHDIQGGHSLTQLKKAVSLEITKITKTTDTVNAEIKLKNIGSGHCIPTGIPTRKLVLEVNLLVKDKIIATQNFEYVKVVADRDGKILTEDWEIMMNGAKVISDNRLKPLEERTETVSFQVPKSYESVISAHVYYVYKPSVIEHKEIKVEINSVDGVALK